MYEISNIQKYVYLLKNLFFAKCHTRQIWYVYSSQTAMTSCIMSFKF